MVSPVDLSIPALSRQKYSKIFEQNSTAAGAPPQEIVEILAILAPPATQDFLVRIHNDVTNIFHGKDGIFHCNCSKYHNLDHTIDVVLAVTRFVHGLYLKKITFPSEIIELCLLTSYFHDVGFLRTREEARKKGAHCLRHHEQRSISFLHEYMEENSCLLGYKDDCAAIINCTDLAIDPATLCFSSSKTKLIGHILGSADLLAQMANRYYLESLELLYEEQQERGVVTHPSLLDLLRKTTDFYNEIVTPRLENSFANICASGHDHFQSWWGIDANLYLELTVRNIAYLEYVVRSHDEEKKELRKLLRRKCPGQTNDHSP